MYADIICAAMTLDGLDIQMITSIPSAVTMQAEDRLNEMQLIILKLLLGYVRFGLQSGIIEKVNGAVLGFFSLEAITKDTCTLFDKC